MTSSPSNPIETLADKIRSEWLDQNFEEALTLLKILKETGVRVDLEYLLND